MRNWSPACVAGAAKLPVCWPNDTCAPAGRSLAMVGELVWLLQIVRNRGQNHARHRKARRVVPLDGLSALCEYTSPAREAERAGLRDRLLAELPADRREVVLFHDREGWMHREIADRMELSPGNVRSHLHHARKRLRKLLRELTEREE